MNIIESICNIFVIVFKGIFQILKAFFTLLWKVIEICRIPELCKGIWYIIVFICTQVFALAALIYHGIIFICKQIGVIVKNVGNFLRIP